MTPTPHEIGKSWEESFCKRIGGTLQPGSGNQFYAKLDVVGVKLLWSLKSTQPTEKNPRPSFRLTPGVVEEAVEACVGPGGVGADVVPGIAVKVDQEELVVLRADDFLALLRSQVEIAPTSRGDARKERARVPSLLRKLEE